jgi:hypothetical protein
MSQIVEYNGQRIEFPDGMPPAEIEATIRRNAMTLGAKPTAPDPTEGMGAFERGAAGAGKALADLGRGLGQYIPTIREGELSTLVTRDDVAEARRRDAPLMRTRGGTVGNLAGNIAMLAPTALIPGANTLTGAAAIGAATGALQPSTSGRETLTNTGLGAFAAPATIMAVRGAQALYQGAKGLVEPLTSAGQDRIAADVLRRSATDPARAIQATGQARELVPGSQPTLAQAAQDPGLAQLERAIMNNPEYAAALQQRYASQRGARLSAVEDVAGTQDYYNAIKDGRRVFANQDYAQAMEQGIDSKMAKAIAPQLQSLLERPSIQRAQQDAIRLAKENGVSLAESPSGSLVGLDWVKKALDNRISIAAQPGSSIGKEELRALVQTKNDLMQTLEQIAPGYKQANDAYAAMSQQVNSMDVARALLDKLQKPGSEYAGTSAKEMGDAYMRALSQAQDSVKKATGMNKSISEVMPRRDIAQLESVARDLGRKAFVENAGRAAGSNTMQNMASQNMLRRLLGPTGLPQSWAESTMLQSMLTPVQAASRLTGADRRVMDRIVAGLLDPAEGVGLLATPSAVPNVGLLGAPATQSLLPAMGLLGVTTRDRR